MIQGIIETRFEGTKTGLYGFGILTFVDGKIHGSDFGGGKYNGVYFNISLKEVRIKMDVIIPPNIKCVQGHITSYERIIWLDHIISNKFDDGPKHVKTSEGAVILLMTYKSELIPVA